MYAEKNIGNPFRVHAPCPWLTIKYFSKRFQFFYFKIDFNNMR